MRLAHSLPQLLLAAALGFTPSLIQDDKPPTPSAGEQGYPWNKMGSKRNEELMKKLVGGWELTRVTAAGLNTNLRDDTGVLLITEDYASFEMHIGWNDPLGGLKDWQFQSGTHKVQLDAQSNLYLTSLIGAAFNVENDLEFTAAGVARGYRVQVNAPRLVLTRVDSGDRFEFKRMPNPSLDADKDIYGRDKK